MTPEFENLKSKLRATWTAGDFAEIAKAYADGAAQFVERLGVKPGTTFLDVACGNGNLAFPAAQLGADVLGVDIASNLVAAGNRRAREHGLANIKFQEGDAKQI